MNIEIVDTQNTDRTETERDGINNSIGTIVSTPYASAPFMRSMGMKNYPPESGSELARNQYATEAITQCGVWEDRAKLEKVYFMNDNEVRMVITGGEN